MGRLRTLAPQPGLALALLHLVFIVTAAFLTALLATSLSLSALAYLACFLLLGIIVFGMQLGAPVLARRRSYALTMRMARVVVMVTAITRPVLRLVPVAVVPGPAVHVLEPHAAGESTNGEEPALHRPEQEEAQMIQAILELRQTQVREVLVPRVDVVAAEATEEPREVIERALSWGFNRIPVFEDNIDHIIGILYVQDLLRHLVEGTLNDVTLRSLVRSCLFVPESKRAYELLREFQERRVYMAIVVDEYGGTAGLVSIEDLLEEIVGEIEDEFGREEPKVEKTSEDEITVDARLSLDDLRDVLGVDIQGQGFDTVGGFVYSQLGRVPIPGDEFIAEGVHLEVLSTSGRRIQKVRITKVEETRAPEEATSRWGG